ncbi:MAG: hypothetical protein WBP84_03180, partial [Nitrososphaeraceae archaeon]
GWIIVFVRGPRITHMIIFITSYFNLWISLFISRRDYLHETTTTPMNVLRGSQLIVRLGLIYTF